MGDFMQVKINVLDYKAGCKAPSRKHYNDAGADVYTSMSINIMPHETTTIPLGFSIEVPDGYMACIFPRSSMALRGLVCEIPPIDSGYRGEVFAIVSNLTDHAQHIPEGMRIGQIVVMPCIICDFVTEFGDERGTGAFGSTGEK